MSQPNKSSAEIIIGIDPGIADTGYAIVSYEKNQLTAIDYGCIVTTPKNTGPLRLAEIQDNINELIKKFKPRIMAVEKLFFNKNVKTALVVGQARGVVLAQAAKQRLQIYEFTPGQVKQSATGHGNASKQQVQEMIKKIFNLRVIPKPDDAADALAIAACCASSIKITDIKK